MFAIKFHLRRFFNLAMALCNFIRKIWREIFWAGEGTKESSHSASADKHSDLNISSVTDGSINSEEKSAGEEDSNSYYWCHGVKFDSEEERDYFERKMNSMHEVFEKELELIKVQHRRLHIERENIKRKMSAIEIAVKRDIAQMVRGRSPEDAARLREELHLLTEMEELLKSLEKEQEELVRMEKCLRMELRERTLYPEPEFKRPRVIEDAFTKQMKLDGGLKYRSNDNTTKFIAYHALPPPLSLEIYKNTADRKKL